MRCGECGCENVLLKRGPHTYRESGLDHVHFTDIELRECSECLEVTVCIPQIASLHRTIARELIHERRPLIGGEVTFLRKILDVTHESLAAHLGLSPLALRLWEEDHEHAQDALLRVLLNAGDRLLRVLVAYRLEVPLDIFSLFPQIKRKHGDELSSFEVKLINGVWAVERLLEEPEHNAHDLQ